MTDVQVNGRRVEWSLPGETGCEITGYDVRFWLAGQVIHMQEGVTEKQYTPPVSAQGARNTQV